MTNTLSQLSSASRSTQVCLSQPAKSCYANTVIGNDPDIDYQTSQIGISSVIYDHDVASCTFTGRDSPAAGPIEKVNDQYNGQLGPPQTITEIDCTCAYDDSYKVKAREPLAPAPAVKARQSDGTCEGSTTIDVTLYAPDGSYEVTVPISAYGTSSDPVIPRSSPSPAL